jgi:GMP synthase-like glutamine amidotransferase
VGAVRALVVNPDGNCPAGMVGDRLEHHGVELDELVVVADPLVPRSDRPFPDPTAYDLVVSMGSPWSVYDSDTIGTWIGRHVDTLRRAHEADVPVLGICFGGQVLAAALGGTVTSSPQPEFGWGKVETTVPDLIAPGPWFQWHVDRFSLPPGVDVLAENDAAVQAFRLGRSLGTQFHPELTVSILERWLVDATHDELGLLDGTPEDLLAETVQRQEEARPHCDALVDGFLRDVADLR